MPTEFILGEDNWSAVSISDKEFEVEFEDNEWTDYDDKKKVSVSVLSVETKIEKMK